MARTFYSDSITTFLKKEPESILGALTQASGLAGFPVEQTQSQAWLEQIAILRTALNSFDGTVHFEFAIPRMGRRVDTVVIVGAVVFVLEFKIGEEGFPVHAIDQVCDYAVDLKNFHKPSHGAFVAPILIATKSARAGTGPQPAMADKVFRPMTANSQSLLDRINQTLFLAKGPGIDPKAWIEGEYSPTPTIIEAAKALYLGHSVEEISRSGADGKNLGRTSETVSKIIADSKRRSKKSICFLTGVPGAGKTLVGLNIANKHLNPDSELYSVFLSGNGPLVAVLREALARNKVAVAKERGLRLRIGKERKSVEAFIQNVHHFRDECLLQPNKPPAEHVALFDEAQRAWNLRQTASFMRRKKGVPDFNRSEPDFLISCLDRHSDWAVIVCLVGGGQEINTGEAGIGEWVEALRGSYREWDVYISPALTQSEYGAGAAIATLKARGRVQFDEGLHLSVSMRSFKAEDVSELVKQLLDLDVEGAKGTFTKTQEHFPIVLTRDLKSAKAWLKEHARGSERFGLLASSQGERLKPHAINVKARPQPVQWFLNGKDDVRSSYYLEDPATEFEVQGLELDWACVTWDADFRITGEGWAHRSFKGNCWKNINQADRRTYQKNAYRVLLTRARQGMVIFIPDGDLEDHTRKPAFYDPTFAYLKSVGFPVI